jgi:hypothetical protein
VCSSDLILSTSYEGSADLFGLRGKRQPRGTEPTTRSGELPGLSKQFNPQTNKSG